MKRISINQHKIKGVFCGNPVKKIVRAINNFMHRKERFLYACAYIFYLKSAKIDLEGVGFLPFIHAQHHKDWAKLKANEFVNYCKKNKIINERYKLALQYAKSL